MLSWKTGFASVPAKNKRFLPTCAKLLWLALAPLTWQRETLWDGGVPGTFQVALCNQREVVGSSARNKFSPAVISDWKWWKWGGTSRPRSCSWLTLWPCGFFPYQRKYTVPSSDIKSDVSQTCFYYLWARKTPRVRDKPSWLVWKTDCGIDVRI